MRGKVGKTAALYLFFSLLFGCGEVPASDAPEESWFSAELSPILLSGVKHKVVLESGDGFPEDAEVLVTRGSTNLFEGSMPEPDDGVVKIPFRTSELGPDSIQVSVDGGEAHSFGVRVIPGWLSILPPLLAILLAIAFRHVLIALLSGIWLGAVFTSGFNPLTGVLRTADTYAVNALADSGHASIIIFSLLLGGMIAVITRSGGSAGLASLVTKRSKTPKSGLLSTWGMGILIFFDDYANALLVGSTMRPITDRLKVSREKLAFVVDGTSATVSSLAIVSSWIAVEIGYIKEQYQDLGLSGDPLTVFLESLPYRFYPILMLAFIVMVIVMGRDFGPMHKAELRARKGKLFRDGAEIATDPELEEVGGIQATSWINAAVPVVAVVVTATLGMYFNGRVAVIESGIPLTLRNIFGNTDSVSALLWASLIGCIAAIAVSLATKSLDFKAALAAWFRGVQSMLLAATILVLAWSLGQVCKDLHTANWLISSIGDFLSPEFLPAVIFVVAAAVAFSTGTSWGTMAILFPLALPISHELAPDNAVIMLGSISSILAGAVWGDHCSPISDTTIMSSMASGCDHIDHVRTQLPYALLVGIVALLLGDVATGLGLYPAWVGLILGGVALFLVVRFLGKRVDPQEAASSTE